MLRSNTIFGISHFIVFVCAGVMCILLSSSYKSASSKANVQDEKIYDTVEVLPKFPGGDAAWKRFVQGYRYPREASERGVSGKVIMLFVVEKDGSLSNFKIERDAGMGTGQAALDLFKKSPIWEPGSVSGNVVRTRFRQTISLWLQKG